MKLRSAEQLQSLLLTLGEKEHASPEALEELWRQKRAPLIQRLVRFRKHQQGKASWSHHRHALMQGIKRFHKSTEGKRFHRTLSRWLATRIFRPKLGVRRGLLSAQREHTMDPYDLLVALSSLKTHLYLERNYFNEQLEQDVAIASLMDYAIPLLSRIETCLFHEGHDEGQLTDEEWELLLRLTDQNYLMKACEAESGSSEFVTVYRECFEAQKQQQSFMAEGFLTNVYAQTVQRMMR